MARFPSRPVWGVPDAGGLDWSPLIIVHNLHNFIMICMINPSQRVGRFAACPPACFAACRRRDICIALSCWIASHCTVFYISHFPSRGRDRRRAAAVGSRPRPSAGDRCERRRSSVCVCVCVCARARVFAKVRSLRRNRGARVTRAAAIARGCCRPLLWQTPGEPWQTELLAPLFEELLAPLLEELIAPPQQSCSIRGANSSATADLY